MDFEKRLRRLEAWAARRPEDECDGVALDRLSMMELDYLIFLVTRQDAAGGLGLSEAERDDLSRLLALAQRELSREQVPCPGEFTCLDYARGRWGFARCPECGRSHPAAPEPLPALPPFAAWAHLLPEDCRSPSSVWKLGFYVRPGGEVVGYLRY